MRMRCPLLVAPAALLIMSCVAYEPQPLDPEALLARHDQIVIGFMEKTDGVSPESKPTGTFATGPSLLALQAAAFAVVHAPVMDARRAELGIARAELVEAGVLPNPTISFDGIDAVAAKSITGSATTVDFVSGLGLSWTIPRPNEINAKEDSARARLAEARAELRAAEWRLVRSVFAAFTELAGIEQRRQLVERLRTIVQRTENQISTARRAEGATVLQDKLPAVQVKQ